MGKSLKNMLLYGILLTAGVTLGMQLSEPAPANQQNSGALGSQVDGTWTQQINDSAGNPIKEVYTFITPEGKTGYFMVPEPAEASEAGAGGALEQLPVSPGDEMSGLQTPSDLLLPDPQAPVVDRFADKTASLLQQLSRRSINWFASWFDSGEE